MVVAGLTVAGCDGDPRATCGDGVMEGDEPCDGADLGGTSCVDQGFTGGDISCTATCELETYFCTTCGDDEVEGDEVCDGSDLGGATCESEGYIGGGELACGADCGAYDVSGCHGSACGNGTIEIPEACDSTDLGGEDCVSLGYLGGALACGPDCVAFDESGCLNQGNGETCASPQFITSLPFTVSGADMTADYTNDATFWHPTCAIAEGVEAFFAVNLTAGEELNFAETGGLFAHVRVMETCSDVSECLVSTNFFVGGDASFVAPETRTYYVVLEDRSVGGVDYDFTISHVVCGDGLRRGSETCDGTELGPYGCTSFGHLGGDLSCDAGCAYDFSACAATTCGDATTQGLEQCDDGNLTAGDGCDGGCLLEMDQEGEPNDTPPDAALNNVWTGTSDIAATWSVPGDVDHYAVTVPAGASLRVETFDITGAPDCNVTDTVMQLLDTDGTTVLASDDDGGVNWCSRIEPAIHPGAAGLAGGTYFVRVVEWSDFGDGPGDQAAPYRVVITVLVPTCGDGVVELGEECDDGNTTPGDGCDASCLIESVPEVEPNDASAMANGPFTSMVAIYPAAIGTVDDHDWYTVTVPGPSSTIDATIVDGLDHCGPTGTIDSELEIYDTDGVTSLAFNADINPVTNYCSAISLTGLAAGTYYIRTAALFFWCSGCTYRYRLLLDVH